MDNGKLKTELFDLDLINELEQIELRGGISPLDSEAGLWCNNTNCHKDKCEKE